MASWQSSPFAGAQIDFSAVGNLYDDYSNAQTKSLQRENMRQTMAHQQQQRGRESASDNAMKAVAAEGFPRDAQGNPDYRAAAERVFKATGNIDAANKVLTFGATQQKLDPTTNDITEYRFYADQEKASGREPQSFVEFRKQAARGGGAPANVQEWQYFNQLPPDDQQRYLTMKRAEKYLDTGTEFVRPNPVAPGQNVSAIPKDVSGEANAKAAGTISEIFDPMTGRKQKIQRQPDGSWRPYGGVEAPSLGEADRGTATELYDRNTGQPVREIPKDLAGAEAEKVRGKTQAEGEAGLPKAGRALQDYEIKSQSVNADIDRAMSQANGWTTGLVGSQLSQVPGTQAYDLSKTLTGIQANLGFETLQNMRDNSPTGGALGAISDRENELLQSTWGSLLQSQSKEQFLSNLNRLKQIKSQYAQLKRQAYEADVQRFGRGAVPNPQTGQMGASGAPAAPPPANPAQNAPAAPQGGGWGIQRLD